MTQREFADYLGYPQSSICQYERGERGIPLNLIKTLAEKGHDVNWITLGKVPKNGSELLTREVDLMAIGKDLARLPDDAVSLTRKWIEMLVTFQESQGRLRPLEKPTSRSLKGGDKHEKL